MAHLGPVLGRGFAVIAIAALMTGVISALSDALAQRPLENFARAIERGRVAIGLDRDFLDRASHLVAAADGTCARAVTRARVTGALFLLHHGAAESRAADRQRLAAMLEDGLACNPLDGNFWLLTAEMRRLDDDSAGFHEAWHRSILTSPFEGRLLDLRWSMAPVLIMNGILEPAADVRRDLSNQLRLVDAAQAGRTLFDLRRLALSNLAADLLPQMSERRRRLMEQHAKRLATPRRRELSPFRSDQQS